MEYTNLFKLGMRPSDTPHVVSAKQNDLFTRFLHIQLTRDYVDYEPEEGVTIQFRCMKPDGALIVEDSSVMDSELNRYLVTDQGGGVIQVELTDSVLDIPGRCKCDLCLIKNEQVLSTDLFVINVVAHPDISRLGI